MNHKIIYLWVMNAGIEVFFFFLHFSEMLIIRTDYRAKITARETTYISFSLKTVRVSVSPFEVCLRVLWSQTPPTDEARGVSRGLRAACAPGHRCRPLGLACQTWTGRDFCRIELVGSALKPIFRQFASQWDWMTEVWGLFLKIRVINN